MSGEVTKYTRIESPCRLGTSAANFMGSEMNQSFSFRVKVAALFVAFNTI